MSIPRVSFWQIDNAFKTFDNDYRCRSEWIGWETRKTQKYVIRHDGKLYPPKMIISLATGLPRSEFNGGSQSIRYLANYNIEVKAIAGSPIDCSRAKQFVPAARSSFKERKNEQVASLHGHHHKLVIELYKLLKKLPRYNYFSSMRQLPDNGIYFFYEVGESNVDGYDRLVRIGTHRSDGKLKSRVRQHYSGNRNSSVFRKHLGGAIINRDCPDEIRLGKWLNKGEPAPAGIESRVSEILEQNFYYSCIEIKDKKERLELEEGLIALFAGEVPEKASPDWLGNYAVSENIKNSSLWNSEHTAGNILTNKQLGRFCELVEESSLRYRAAQGPKALVLIPCCKSKAAVFSEHWSAPFPELQQLRNGIIERICETDELFEKDDNLGGILNPDNHPTRALDLYVGNFYYAAGNSLKQVASGNIVTVDVLIVSALYGLALLNEGLKKYELRMSDRLQDGTKVYRYWQDKGLATALADYIDSNRINTVWSLLPDSMPASPYHQVFKAFWEKASANGLNCYHVKVPGAGTGTGYQRGKWLRVVLENDPDMLLDEKRMPTRFNSIPGYEFNYSKC
jgi:hypothetical protein